MSQEAMMTLYTSIQNTNKIWEFIQQYFSDVAKEMQQEQNEMEVLLQDDTTMKFYMQYAIDDIKDQIEGMITYFSQAPCENKALMNSIQQQISLFTCITGISFTIDEDQNRTNAIVGRLYDVAKASASILLYPDMSLYTPDGALLLNMEGESELQEYRPIAYQDILGEAPTFGEDDEQRYQLIRDELKEKGFPFVSYMMSTQLHKDRLVTPTLEEIVQRCIAIFSCAVCAEGTLMQGGSRTIGLQEFQALDEIFHCTSYLSQKETAFIEGEGDMDESVQMSWRYECCAVLLWALGLYQLDTSFEQLCDVGTMAQTIRSFSSVQEMCEASHLKSIEELLAYHTRVLYYDWSCVEANIKGVALEGIDTGVVMEHHYAMNWLCGANHTKDWDEIQCNT